MYRRLQLWTTCESARNTVGRDVSILLHQPPDHCRGEPEVSWGGGGVELNSWTLQRQGKPGWEDNELWELLKIRLAMPLQLYAQLARFHQGLNVLKIYLTCQCFLDKLLSVHLIETLQSSSLNVISLEPGNIVIRFFITFNHHFFAHSGLDENWDVQRFLCKNQFNIFLTK